MATFEYIIVESKGAVGIITLNRPKLLNALSFGVFLATLTRLGLENTQAFTALGFAGFRHFLRMRVRADGSAIETDEGEGIGVFTWLLVGAK